MMSQRTIAAPVQVEGVALHCGEHARAVLEPAPPGAGVVFSVDGVDVPARWDRVCDTQLATTVGLGASRVRTVEHLLSAVNGLGLDNLRVTVEGGELPILDGCGARWVSLIQSVGMVDQKAPAAVFQMLQAVEVNDGDRMARLEPNDGFSLDVTIDFDHPAVGRQRLDLVMTPGVYERELAWARTFGFARLVPAMQRMGLVRGGSLDNALVFDDRGPMNEGGLLSPDEPVRHKMLDAMGDLCLLGPRIKGRLVAERPGHGLIVGLTRAIQQQPDAWAIVR